MCENDPFRTSPLCLLMLHLSNLLRDLLLNSAADFGFQILTGTWLFNAGMSSRNSALGWPMSGRIYTTTASLTSCDTPVHNE
jgi:hypothetical protein